MIKLTIWIVEDDAGYRRTLQKLLSREEHITCDQVFSSCQALFEALEKGPQPDLVLMDLGLPGMSGVEGIQMLATLAPDLAVLVLTVFSEKKRVLEALDAGAAGYLLKSSSPQEIVKGIQDVFTEGATLSPAVAKIVMEEMNKSRAPKKLDLTRREMEVLRLMAADMPAKQIADELGISIHTTSFHIKNLYKKLHVHSQSGAIATAFRSGIL